MNDFQSSRNWRWPICEEKEKNKKEENKKETSAMKAIISLLMSVSWLAGIVVAQGWLKIFAILLPPYAWYLLLERLMKVYGLI